MQYQRYDTYVGDYSVHQNPQVYFIDPVGTAILEKLNIDNFYSWADYIKVFIKYPVSVIGIYVRHLVNILLPCWPSIYITDLDNSKIIYALISYTICFVIVVALLKKYINECKTLIRFIPLLVPMVFILPGAVEVRFFIAGYIMSFCIVSFFINWKKLLEYIKTNVWKMIIIYLGAGSIVLSMWSSFLETELENGILM